MASVGLRALETAQGERGEFDQFGVSTRSTGYARGWVRRCATALRVSTRTRVFVGRSSAPVGGRRGSHDHHGGGLQAWVVALIATHLPASLNPTLAGHVTAPPTCLLSSAERRIRGHLLRPCAGRGPEMEGDVGRAPLVPRSGSLSTGPFSSPLAGSPPHYTPQYFAYFVSYPFGAGDFSKGHPIDGRPRLVVSRIPQRHQDHVSDEAHCHERLCGLV